MTSNHVLHFSLLHFTNNPDETNIQASITVFTVHYLRLHKGFFLFRNQRVMLCAMHGFYYSSPTTARSFRSVTGDRSLLPGCMIRGLAPRYARLTLAFLPSMMGFGSLQALSAAARSAIVTYTKRGTQRHVRYFQFSM